MKDTAFIDGARRLIFFVVAAAIVLVYVPSRLFLLYYGMPASGSDSDLYARYAYIQRLAFARRVPFHDFYRAMGLADIAAGRPKIYDSLTLTVVAYPPFAVAVLKVPALFVQGNRMALPEFTVQYKKAYHWFCAAAEMLTVVIAGLLVLVLYKDEKPVVTAFRMTVLCLAGLCMPRILYDRLDVILSALLVLSLVLLVKKRVLMSFFIFALAVNFKLIPVFLLPVWILGSFKALDFELPTRRERVLRMARMGLTRGLLLCGMTAGVALLFYSVEGRHVFDFISFHLVRGIHIESIWGTFSLLAARLSGTPFQVALAYGAYNVVTPAAPFLSALSPITLAAFVAAVTVILAVRFVVVRGRPGYSLSPEAVIEASLLYLCIVFSFSKIFSPQFLFVLVPLVALLPYTGRGAFVISCVFIGVCCLSTLIYPYFYSKAILHGQTWFGLFLLTARMLLLAGMAGFLFLRQLSWKSGGRN